MANGFARIKKKAGKIPERSLPGRRLEGLVVKLDAVFDDVPELIRVNADSDIGVLRFVRLESEVIAVGPAVARTAGDVDLGVKPSGYRQSGEYRDRTPRL